MRWLDGACDEKATTVAARTWKNGCGGACYGVSSYVRSCVSTVMCVEVELNYKRIGFS